MKKCPWAKLAICMTPKANVSPTAIKANMPLAAIAFAMVCIKSWLLIPFLYYFRCV